MARIIRTNINADFDGNILSAKQEQLKDDEAGTIEETYLTALSRCQACSKPIVKVEEIWGRCIICNRYCCYRCAGYCSICGRGPLCGLCKEGFPEKGLSICSNCLPALRERLVYQDQLLEEKVAFEQTIAVYNAQIKLVQLLQQNKGPISNVLAQIKHSQVTRKVARLERKLKQETGRGKRLFP